MSFRFGEFDTAVVEGVTATLKAWPSLTLSPETVDLLDFLGLGHGLHGLLPHCRYGR